MQYAVRENAGNRIVFQQVKDIESFSKEAMRQGFLHLMRELKIEARREMIKKNKTGQVYIRRTESGRRRRHRASSPGQTHAKDTGKLRKSLSFKVRGYNSATFGYGIVKGDAPKYAVYAEQIDGNTNPSARPSLLNAIKAVDQEQIFERAIEQLVHKKMGL